MNYWLFSIMYDWYPETWPRMVKMGIAAQHYPPGWTNEGKNIKHLEKLRKGDRIVAAFHGHCFAGYGTLRSDFYRGGPSMKIRGKHGLYEFGERFDLDRVTLPLTGGNTFADLHDLKARGFDIDLTIGLCVKQTDKDSYEAIRDELDRAGAKPRFIRPQIPAPAAISAKMPIAAMVRLPANPAIPSLPQRSIERSFVDPDDRLSNRRSTAFAKIEAIFKSHESGNPVVPPTIIYSEGWMLRLVLDRFASLGLETTQHPLAIPKGCRWYSEALLPSAFRPRFRGDNRGEFWSHADGVIGHFDVGDGGRGGLTHRSDARHLVVIEAKMFSSLASGVKNAPGYNQVARNIACMAKALKAARKQAKEFKTLGFYVIAPECQFNKGILKNYLDKDHLRSVVERRVGDFLDSPDIGEWFSDWFLLLLEHLTIKKLSWEEIVGFLNDRDPNAGYIEEFYTKCLEFNGHVTPVSR